MKPALLVTFLSTVIVHAAPVSYYREVRPLLRANCTGCHKPAKKKGGLDLTSVETLLQGGEAGPVKPGHAADAEILKQLSGAEPAMPKDGDPLTAAEIALLRRWIEEGAKDDTPSDPGEVHRLAAPPVYKCAPAIASLAWSPDGTTLAVAAWHEVILRSGDGTELLGRLTGDASRIESLAFSPDGKQLAVAGGAPSEFGEVQIWDVTARKLKRSIKASNDCFFGVSWSPDGKHVAVGCADKLVRVFDAGDGREMMRCDNHLDWVFATAWSRDGKRLVSASRDKAIKLIDPSTGHLVDDIAQPREPLLCVARHPAEDLVAFGGDNGQVRLHKVAPRGGRLAEGDNKEESTVREFERIPGPAHALAFSPDGTLLAATGARGETRIWKSADGKRVAQISGEIPLYTLAFTHDGKTLATAGADGRIRLYDSATGKMSGDFIPVPMAEK
jgi:WD40 repeat protein/mono/diheme cytochrome c family protein